MMVEPQRERLAAERIGLTHRFEISTETGARVFYLTCGIYPDGRLGELFLHAGKEGSLIAGALDGHAISVSIGLQHGVPLRTYLSKMRYTQFEPSGLVIGSPEKLLAACSVGAFFAKSPFDYIAAYLEWKFPEGQLLTEDLALLPKPPQE
jgi:ribonucleoside-diphosphate reductase alpha chain